jgi:glycosyltransferase involved in cell wall biosynthesis
MPEPASRERPPLTVIVPTRDRPQMLARCLASVRASAGADDEVVVVDSASADAATVAELVAAAGARLVRCDLPGVCRARNAGWKAATHHLLAFTDDDVVVDAGWADALARSAAAHPEAAFVTGRISVPEGQQVDHRSVAIKDDLHAEVLDARSRGDLGHSANLLVRASALARVGGWDESLGAGGRFPAGPEIDLFDRLFGAGLAGRYEPSARAWHDQWRDKGELLRLDWRYGTGNGARLAKLVRTDRRRARRVAVDSLWGWGLQLVPSTIRDRNKTALLLIVIRLAGTGAGFVRALTVPLRDGRFVIGRTR